MLNHQQFFDQAADDWDARLREELLARVREIVSRLDIALGAAVLDAVFPLFPNKLRALSEIQRVLRSPEPAEGRAGGFLVICHTASRQAINEFHRSVGGVVAHDTIPDEREMLRLLRKAGLVEAQVRDEPDRYLALAQRDSRP